MFRFLVSAAFATLLAGCVTTDYRYYGERDYRAYDPVAADDGYVRDYDDRVAGGYAGSVYVYPDWFDYPAYYSIYWPLHRYYVDPFWHPHFYYGVTWFPRNYFSVGISYGSRSPYDVSYRWWPYYGYLSYSPYRLSWIDYYYDWYPWYVRYPHHDYDRWNHYYAPRYGSARNEAERLSRYTGLNPGRRPYVRDDGLSPRRWDDNDSQRQRLIERRENVRGADYGSRTGGRLDPGVSGFRNDGPTRSSPRDTAGRPSSSSPARTDPRAAEQGNARNPARDARGVDVPRNAGPRNDVRDTGERTPRQRQDSEGIPYPYRDESNGGRRAVGAGTAPATPRPSSSGNSYPVWRDRSPAPVERDTPRSYESSQPRYTPRESSRDMAPPTRGYTPQPRVSEENSAPRFSAPRPEPRPQTEYVPPSRGGWSAPPERSRDADRYSAPPQRESGPRFSPPPEREARGESSREASPRAELNRRRDDDDDN